MRGYELMTQDNNTARRRKKRRRGRRVYKVITALIIVIALVLAVNFLFRVNTIEVNGVSHHTAQEVIDASGIKMGQCLYLVNKFKVVDNLAASLTYVEDIDIYRRLPDTIVIDITERTPSAMVKCGADYWVLDENCRVLDKVRSLEEISSTTTVIGIEALSASPGSVIEVSSEEKTALAQLTAVLKGLQVEDMVGAFTTIDVTDPYNVVCMYDGDRIKVIFGDCTDMAYRVRFFRAIVNERSSDETGSIDIRDTQAPRFIEG